MNNLGTLNLDLAEQRYGALYIDDICFARRIALEMDRDPLAINKYKDQPTIKNLCQDRDASCFSRTQAAEAISYGDANVFLACPNPSLAGGAMREMGGEEHKKYFFDFIDSQRCTTFAGITEPKHGSDVASIETVIEKVDAQFYKITGEKCFITHGYDGKIAILIARTSSGPLGITGVLLTKDDLARGQASGSLRRELLPLVGMKGTCLSRLVFNDFIVPAENLLGQHLRSTQRGMLAIIKTFNLMRPCVAGFVLGQAQAIVDYVDYLFKPANFSTKRLIAKLNAELSNARKVLYQSAELIGANPLDSGCVSLSKAQITSLAERICCSLIDELGAAAFCEHPLLLKWLRDVYGFEYMEGTTGMQKRNVYQKHLKRTRGASS